MKNYSYDQDPLLQACGIRIEKQLTQVDGRVLEAPKVCDDIPQREIVSNELTVINPVLLKDKLFPNKAICICNDLPCQA